ncbi:ATP-binding protein [Nesterenkonia rhizosphaerae]|uniref:Uncharacterized protein n=1 Tax=Nesterenkonia rhizosphaerae TaxID=1348272 RepID=A0ABP9G0E0_9MICC
MQATATVTTETTLDTERMGVAPDEGGVLAEILSSLYTNHHEAALREYTANGIDAHVEAGTTRPVEVYLPTHLNPQLRIVDHGIGMTPEVARQRFATYVSSSKRSTNSAIGHYGIGSKSGFAIADVITVETTRDGVATRLVAIMKDDGPHIAEFTTEETTAPSGTTVTLPADPSVDWDRLAERALCFTGGAVKVNGKTPEDPRSPLPEGGYAVVSRLIKDTFDGNRVIMGRMSYAIPDGVNTILTKHLTPGFAVEVPMSLVRISPTRESIIDSTTNAEALLEYIKSNWLDEAEQRFLGENPWQTLYNVMSHRHPGTAMPTSVWKHIAELMIDTAYRSRRYAATTIDSDSKRKRLGSVSSPGSAVDRIRRTSLDRLAFVEHTSTSSPKVRRWLWDHSDFTSGAQEPALLVAAPVSDLPTIAAAGFPVLSAEQLSSYQPVRSLPRNASTAREVHYRVLDLGGSEHVYTPETIREKYSSITIIQADSGGGVRSTYKTALRTVHGTSLAVVMLSPQHSSKAAQSRIGLPIVSLREALTGYIGLLEKPLTALESAVLKAWSHYDGHAPRDFKRLPWSVERAANEIQKLAEEVHKTGESFKLAVSADFEKSRKLAKKVLSGSTMASVTKKVAESGLDPETWLTSYRILNRTSNSAVWPEKVERLRGALSSGLAPADRAAVIAGFLLSWSLEDAS